MLACAVNVQATGARRRCVTIRQGEICTVHRVSPTPQPRHFPDRPCCARVQHTVLAGGELSASWISQTPPMLWPAKCGQTKPFKKTRDTIDVSDPAYVRGLSAKFQAVMSGRVTCILSQSEKTLRYIKNKREEADEVASLQTPREAQNEQILEEALRKLQVQTFLHAARGGMVRSSVLQNAGILLTLDVAGKRRAKDQWSEWRQSWLRSTPPKPTKLKSRSSQKSWRSKRASSQHT